MFTSLFRGWTEWLAAACKGRIPSGKHIVDLLANNFFFVVPVDIEDGEDEETVVASQRAHLPSNAFDYFTWTRLAYWALLTQKERDSLWPQQLRLVLQTESDIDKFLTVRSSYTAMLLQHMYNFHATDDDRRAAPGCKSILSHMTKIKDLDLLIRDKIQWVDMWRQLLECDDTVATISGVKMSVQKAIDQQSQTDKRDAAAAANDPDRSTPADAAKPIVSATPHAQSHLIPDATPCAVHIAGDSTQSSVHSYEQLTVKSLINFGTDSDTMYRMMRGLELVLHDHARSSSLKLSQVSIECAFTKKEGLMDFVVVSKDAIKGLFGVDPHVPGSGDWDRVVNALCFWGSVSICHVPKSQSFKLAEFNTEQSSDPLTIYLHSGLSSQEKHDTIFSRFPTPEWGAISQPTKTIKAVNDLMFAGQHKPNSIVYKTQLTVGINCETGNVMRWADVQRKSKAITKLLDVLGKAKIERANAKTGLKAEMSDMDDRLKELHKFQEVTLTIPTLAIMGGCILDSYNVILDDDAFSNMPIVVTKKWKTDYINYVDGTLIPCPHDYKPDQNSDDEGGDGDKSKKDKKDPPVKKGAKVQKEKAPEKSPEQKEEEKHDRFGAEYEMFRIAKTLRSNAGILATGYNEKSNVYTKHLST